MTLMTETAISTPTFIVAEPTSPKPRFCWKPLVDELASLPCLTWVRLDLLQLPGTTTHNKRLNVITAIRHHLGKIQTTVEGDFLFIRRVTDSLPTSDTSKQ